MTDRRDMFFQSHMSKYRKGFSIIEPYITQDSVIFDIGSNIGMFSLAICESTKYNTLYLFEPSRELIDYSKEKLAGYPNVHFINKGVGSTNESLILYKNTDSNIGWNSYYQKDPLQPGGVLPINKMEQEDTVVITLDTFCDQNQISNIDFVKIDVEGMEFKVLEGFLLTLQRLDKKPYLYVEVGWGTAHPEWDLVNSVYEKIFDLGYNRVTFTDKTEDVLFIPL